MTNFLKQLSILCLLVPLTYTCEKPEREIIVETGSVQNIGSTHVTVTINIIDLGDGISTYGHMASTDNSFTVNVKESTLLNPNTAGLYASTINGLSPNTLYYIRAYATGPDGTVYGKSISFTTLDDVSIGSFTDERDDHEYNWIKIGNQDWMAENLAYLPSVSPSSSGSSTSVYYYVFNYEGTSVGEAKYTANYATYGVLYNWPAAMSDACPSGWHLPSDAEWTELTDYLGGETLAGGKMKETGYTHWISPNEGATNSSGFTGLPGGYRLSDSLSGGYFYYYSVGTQGAFWSAMESSAANAWSRELRHFDGTVGRHPNDEKQWGFSVRCVKD